MASTTTTQGKGLKRPHPEEGTSASSTALTTTTTTETRPSSPKQAGGSSLPVAQPLASSKRSKPEAAPPRAAEGAHEFARAALAAAVAQLCVDIGFAVAEGGAFRGLVDACAARIVDHGRALSQLAEGNKRKTVTQEDVFFRFRQADPREVNLRSLRDTMDGWRAPGISGVLSFPIETQAVPAPAQTSERGVKRADGAALDGPLGPHFPPLPEALPQEPVTKDWAAQVSKEAVTESVASLAARKLRRNERIQANLVSRAAEIAAVQDSAAEKR